MPTDEDFLYIAGRWEKGKGNTFSSKDPCTGEIVWRGHAANDKQVSDAVSSAQQAFKEWSKRSFEERKIILSKVQALLNDQKEDLAKYISKETGKPHWESRAEMGRVVDKFVISEEAYSSRCGEQTMPLPNASLVIRHKPHGVTAVLGPFNFPLHLVNAHIVPALLAGNTVVLKPSELTPGVSYTYIKCWHEAGIPPGILNFIQGGPEAGAQLASDERLNGLFFTGSWQTGKKLLEASLPYPHRITALEMGGNNPIIVWKSGDTAKAAEMVILSAFISTGQRCTCARRLILPRTKEGSNFVKTLVEMTKSIIVGKPDSSPEPFMGPLINIEAKKKLIDGYNELVSKGAKPILALDQNSQQAFILPMILDSSQLTQNIDHEYFGPLLQIFWADSFDEALHLANKTAYGLSAALISSDPDLYQQFWEEIRAGVVNWNNPTTGISSKAPFGGLGKSGNFRPGAFYAADYTAYPVSSMETAIPESPQSFPGLPNIKTSGKHS